jgi:AcrR family transcriptional regulator
VAVKRSARVPTGDQILAAARTVLHRDGVARLSTRAVAGEAGVNLSLIHYYFRSREGLLLALLERMDADLLARQRVMYARKDTTLAEKWSEAIAFYRDDLKSGYVRTLLELTAYGYANRRIATEVRKLLKRWRDLLSQAAAGTLTGDLSVQLDPKEVGSMVTSYWLGMELQHLLGVPEDEGALWKTVGSLGQLIERWETSKSKRKEK